MWYIFKQKKTCFLGTLLRRHDTGGLLVGFDVDGKYWVDEIKDEWQWAGAATNMPQQQAVHTGGEAKRRLPGMSRSRWLAKVAKDAREAGAEEMATFNACAQARRAQQRLP